ncbi:MAG: hypothetical protein H6Q69_3872 [Firmicutes bacterium]|nr:hypothetical protein [Bacillota bacterium]
MDLVLEEAKGRIICFSLIDWISGKDTTDIAQRLEKSFERIFAVPAEEMKDVMGMRVVTMKCGCQHPVYVTPKQ